MCIDNVMTVQISNYSCKRNKSYTFLNDIKLNCTKSNEYRLNVDIEISKIHSTSFISCVEYMIGMIHIFPPKIMN